MKSDTILQIQFEMSGLDEIVQKCQAFQSDAAETIQEAILDSIKENVIPLAKALAPKKTGALAGSIDVVPLEAPNVALVATKEYAPYMESGEMPHEIEARNAKVLHWTKDGQDFFAKKVMHPGIPEGKFSFLGPAMQEGMEKVVAAIEQVMISIFTE